MPGKPAAKSRKYDVVAFTELFFIVPEEQGNCGGGSISIPLDVHHHFFRSYTHTGGSSVDNTFVCLVGGQPVHIGGGEIVFLHDPRAYFGHVNYCVFEHSLPFLVHVMHFICNSFEGWRPQ